jgi:hypothetical protein
MIKEVFTLTCLVIGLAAGRLPAAEHPQAEISNSQIHATVYLPDAARGYYRGTRFDWSGVVGALEFKGHNYYGPWFQRMDPKVYDFVYDGPDIIASTCSAITGPVEEFAPLGYDETKAGDTFIKIGVGVLRKPRQAAYDAFYTYEIADPGKWTVRKGPGWIEFTQEISDKSGYAYLYRKTVRLSKDRPEMILEHSLRNTGRQRIETSAYDHNFLVLDKQPPGPDFVVAFPFEIRTDRPPDRNLAEIRGNQIVYLKTLAGQDRIMTAVQGFSYSPKDYDIRIENRRVGAGMRIRGDRPLSKESFWSIRSVLSVEPFVAIAIEPGSEFTWRLTYNFYTLPVKSQ